MKGFDENGLVLVESRLTGNEERISLPLLELLTKYIVDVDTVRKQYQLYKEE